MTGPSAAPDVRRRGVFSPAAAAVALLLGGLLGASPSPAEAQEPSIRAVETVDPSDGSRSMELMRPLTAPEVAAVQRRLAALGHRPGEPDGSLDERTRRALTSFQRGEGLDACGCVDVATVRRLDLDLRVLVTRVAGGGRRADAPDAGSDAADGVQVLYPSTTRPDRAEPDRTREAPESDGAAGEGGPTREAAPGPGFHWTHGPFVPVPVPIFLGGEVFLPGDGAATGPRTRLGNGPGLRPTPPRRVPFPGSRPTPSSSSGKGN